MIKKIFRGIGKVIKAIFKPFFGIPKWMGWSEIKERNQEIGVMAKSVFRPAPAGEARQETFEEAIVRLNLNETTLQARKRSFFRMTFFYLLLALAAFVYGIYLLTESNFILDALIAFALTWLLGSLAFRQHFWYTQMKHRRLGLTAKDWFNMTFRGENP